MDLVQKIIAFVEFVRTLDLSHITWGNATDAIKMILDIINIIMKSMEPLPMFSVAKPVMKSASASVASKSTDDLVTELQAHAEAPAGPIISLILPILMELLRRFLKF